MQTVVAILFVVHGFIVASQASGSFNPIGGLPNPSWLAWWPTGLGQSWALAGLGIEQSTVARAGGIIWIVAGLALVGAGLGIFGFLVPASMWRNLALFGAIASLVMLALFAHPFYAIGAGASLAILVAVAGSQTPLLQQLGP